MATTSPSTIANSVQNMQDIKQVVTEIIHLIVMYDVSPINSRALPFTVYTPTIFIHVAMGVLLGFQVP